MGELGELGELAPALEESWRLREGVAGGLQRHRNWRLPEARLNGEAGGFCGGSGYKGGGGFSGGEKREGEVDWGRGREVY